MTDCGHAGKHGTASAYRQGCRCADAREAHRLYMKRRREGRQPSAYVDMIGTRRRIEALRAIGWPTEIIAAEALGWSRALRDLPRGPLVLRTTADKIRAFYDTHSMTLGPSTRTRAHAARAGWAPPLAWDDDEIDDPQAQPHGVAA